MAGRSGSQTVLCQERKTGINTKVEKDAITFQESRQHVSYSNNGFLKYCAVQKRFCLTHFEKSHIFLFIIKHGMLLHTIKEVML